LTVRIPLAGEPSPEAVEIRNEGGLITIVAREAPLGEVLGLLARQQGLNIITGEDIKSRVSITLTRVPFRSAIESILAIAGYTAVQQNNILLITSIAAEHKVSSLAQGRVVQVFRLDYVSATDVNVIIKGLLSPVGQSFMSQVKEGDNRKTQEVLVVEDVPSNLERLARMIQQLDVAPRQVLIEAHILSVTLSDDTKCGVNLGYLAGVNPAIAIRSDGLADAASFAVPNSTQAFFFNLASSDLNNLVSALQTTANVKTLASPKVFAVNGQQAKIQIGNQYGYKTTTTTQTSTMESVNFLDTGVILTVTPQITPDNQVLMKVKPEVSTGEINPTTSLPDSTTTQVETSVLLPDGRGIVIGGLIQETDSDNQSKVPFLGDLWLVGRLFQYRETNRVRNEVIISLIPHIVPRQVDCRSRAGQEFCRSATPLLQGPLQKYPRPWEPSLPDAGDPPPIFCQPNPQCAHFIRAEQPARGDGPPPAYLETIPPPSGQASTEGLIQQPVDPPMSMPQAR
jgi:type II secretory pathway component GspD/PulD (secretin)